MAITFVHLSDTHLGPEKDFIIRDINPYRRCEAVIEAIEKLPFRVDFVLHSGDVANQSPLGSRGAYELANKLFSRLKSPVYYLVGNHDYAEEMLNRLDFPSVEWLSKRIDYRFECQEYDILALNVRKDENAQGLLLPEQFRFIEDVLASKKPALFFLHIPPVDLGIPWYRRFTGSNGDDSTLIENGEEFHQFLLEKGEKNQVKGVFFGHVHATHAFCRDGIFYSSVMSTAFQFEAYPSSTEVVWDTKTAPGFQVVEIGDWGVRVTSVRL